VTIYANLEGLDLGRAMMAVGEIARKLNLPEGYSFDFSGRGKVFREMTGNFAVAFLLAFLFMYMILAAQFESFLHPITILLSLPLSLPCALASLLFLGEDFNLYSGLGLFMLFGVVKKNGILQIDYTNTLRRRGLERNQAILQANHVRLRPILMTTLTLIVGMIPIALGKGPGAASRASMAKVIIGGQALSLVISLLIVPVAYSLFDDLAERLRARARKSSLSLLLDLVLGVPIAILGSFVNGIRWVEDLPVRAWRRRGAGRGKPDDALPRAAGPPSPREALRRHLSLGIAHFVLWLVLLPAWALFRGPQWLLQAVVDLPIWIRERWLPSRGSALPPMPSEGGE
jgi:hypothetical protein